ncbi:MAG: hypothetical protein WCG79_06990, partial [Verrucomicrobiota bacterium]
MSVSWLLWLSCAPQASATVFVWTNTTAGSSAIWANGFLWGSAAVDSYPGRNAIDDAYLTNSATSAYTNIYNANIAIALNSVSVWNDLGEAWLMITNATLTTAAVIIDNGGRLWIDNRGTLNETAAFTWRGTNGVIYLNTGGQWLTAINSVIGNGISNVNATVSTTSGAGLGGTWNLNNQGLTVGNGAARSNRLTITGVTVTNVGVVLIGVGGSATNSGNALTLSNGGRFFSGNLTNGIGGS